MDKVIEFNNILQSFKVKAKCINYSKNRNASIYDITLDPGARVKDLEKYSNEISLYLKSKSKPRINILSEIGVVRVEVIDEYPDKLLLFKEFFREKFDDTSSIPVYLGVSTGGKSIQIDLAKHPHTLIAGTTGSGKSTLLHTIIANLLSRNDVRIFLSDPKNIEFSEYSSLGISVVNDLKSTIKTLSILNEEMDYRYNQLSRYKKYNGKNIVLIIDEFSDLIMEDTTKEFYNKLCRLSQKSRAAGIYCIIATQRPSADIIKGAIKANFPARIACKTASKVDSKVILDASGAEALVGYGDAIINNYNNSYQRFQVAYATPKEIISIYGKV